MYNVAILIATGTKEMSGTMVQKFEYAMSRTSKVKLLKSCKNNLSKIKKKKKKLILKSNKRHFTSSKVHW